MWWIKVDGIYVKTEILPPTHTVEDEDMIFYNVGAGYYKTRQRFGCTFIGSALHFNNRERAKKEVVGLFCPCCV